MKKPSKVLSMVLAVMMVMSSFAGLAVKAADPEPDYKTYVPNAVAETLGGQAKATLKSLDGGDEVILVDDEGKAVVLGSELTLNDVIGAESYDFYKYDDEGKLEKYDDHVIRNEVYELKFTKLASTSGFDIKEIRVYVGEEQVDTLTNPEITFGYNGAKEYTYTGLTYNDLSGAGGRLSSVADAKPLEHSFKFVVTAKTLDFSTDLDESFDKIAEVGLVDENNKLEYGKDFEFTINPKNGYAFNDVLNKLKVSVYDGKGEEESTFSKLNIIREGLYNFKISAESEMGGGTPSTISKYGVNDILKASYGVNSPKLAVSNIFDTEDLDSNIVSSNKGIYIPAKVEDKIKDATTDETIGSVEAKEDSLFKGEGASEGQCFIKPGIAVELTATPEEGYKLVDVKVDNLNAAKGQAKVEVSTDGTTAKVLFDADVALADNKKEILITPVFEKPIKINFVGGSDDSFIEGSLNSEKVYHNDKDVELTLNLTEYAIAIKGLFNSRIKGSLYASVDNASVKNDIILNYDRTDTDKDGNENIIYKCDFSNLVDDVEDFYGIFSEGMNFDIENIYYKDCYFGELSVYDYGVLLPINVYDMVAKAYFLFNDITAFGSKGKVAINEYNSSTKEYDKNVTDEPLEVGKKYQVTITPDPDVNQPLLNVSCRSGSEIENLKANYEKDTKGNDTDVVKNYTFEFKAGYPIDLTDIHNKPTYVNHFTLTFGAKQSKYVSIDITGGGSITLEKSLNNEYGIAELDGALSKPNGEVTVYLVPKPKENLEPGSLTVEKVTTNSIGATEKEPVEITPAIGNEGVYEVKLKQDEDAKAKFVITAKFKEAAKSYPVINGTPYENSEENGGYLSLTLPNLGQKEVYAGQEITVSAVPNKNFKVDQVLVYIADNHDGIVLDLKEDESAKRVYNGSYTLTDADAENAQYVKFVAKFEKVEEKPVDPDVPTSNDWKQNEDGTWSFVNENGKLLTGWHDDIRGWEGQWFYFDENGIMAIGWQGKIPGWEGQWFYFDMATGVMKTGWIEDKGEWYYLDPTTGVMKTGWLELGKVWYYLDPTTGAMYCNRWYQNWDGKHYYFGKNGAMLTNTHTPDGYYVDASGAWVPGYNY